MRAPPHEYRPLSPVERVLLAQSAVLIVFSSWAFGGRVSWAPPIILTLAGLSALPLWIHWRSGAPLRLRSFIPLAGWLVLLIVGLLNPSHFQLANGTWAPRPGWISWLPTVVDRHKAWSGALPWLAALWQGGVMVAISPGRRFARMLWGTIAINGCLLAIVGAGFRFSGANKVLGFVTAPEQTYFFATFFYKNHWAAYGALGVIASLALAVGAWRGVLDGSPRDRGMFWLFSITALLTAITLPLPGSRSGALFAVALLAGFISVLFFHLWRKRNLAFRQRAIIGVIVGGLIAGAFSYGWANYRQRGWDLFRTEQQIRSALKGDSPGVRFLAARDTFRMVTRRPWFGWGVGCFELVFPVFQGNYLRDAEGKPTARFEFAHNDWLQILAETGVTGLAILLLAVFTTARSGWSSGSISRRWILMGCALIALYALIDFPFYNPAVLMAWTMLLVSTHRRHIPAAEHTPQDLSR